MKKRFSLLALLLFGIAHVYAQTSEDSNTVDGPVMVFEESTHNFGDIKQGEIVAHTFKFENTGNEPLIISNIATTCGCTASDWPKEPVMPGEMEELKITFNSASKMGIQNKVITIFSNAVNPQERIKILVNVLPN